MSRRIWRHAALKLARTNRMRRVLPVAEAEAALHRLHHDEPAGVRDHDEEAGHRHKVRRVRVPVRDGALRGGIPRASADAHDDEPGAALGVHAEVLGGEGEDAGVADTLEAGSDVSGW